MYSFGLMPRDPGGDSSNISRRGAPRKSTSQKNLRNYGGLVSATPKPKTSKKTVTFNKGVKASNKEAADEIITKAFDEDGGGPKDKNVWKVKGKSMKEITESMVWLKTYKLDEDAPTMNQSQVDKSYKNLNKYIDEKIDAWIEIKRDQETDAIGQ